MSKFCGYNRENADRNAAQTDLNTEGPSMPADKHSINNALVVNREENNWVMLSVPVDTGMHNLLRGIEVLALSYSGQNLSIESQSSCPILENKETLPFVVHFAKEAGFDEVETQSAIEAFDCPKRSYHTSEAYPSNDGVVGYLKEKFQDPSPDAEAQFRRAFQDFSWQKPLVLSMELDRDKMRDGSFPTLNLTEDLVLGLDGQAVVIEMPENWPVDWSGCAQRHAIAKTFLRAGAERVDLVFLGEEAVAFCYEAAQQQGQQSDSARA